MHINTARLFRVHVFCAPLLLPAVRGASTLSSLLLLSSLKLEVLAARAMKHVRTGHLFGVDLGEFGHLALVDLMHEPVGKRRGRRGEHLHARGLVDLMHEPRVGYDERLVEPADLLC